MEFPYASRSVEDTNATFSDDELQMEALTANPPLRQSFESVSVDNESGDLPSFQPQNSPPSRPWMNDSFEKPQEKEDNSFFSNFNFESQSDQGSTASPTHSYIDDEAELKEKRLMLQKIRRYELRKGIKPEKSISIHSSLEEIKTELDAIRKECQLERTVDGMKKALVFFTMSIETLNKKYDPLDLYLDGWSAEIDEDIDSYEDVLERLYDLYYEHLEMHPLLELGMMLAFSAATHHASRASRGMKIFEGPKPPSVQSQLQPPSGDLAQQILAEDLQSVKLTQ